MTPQASPTASALSLRHATPWQRLLRRAVLGRLASLRHGSLVLRESGGVHVFGAAPAEAHGSASAAAGTDDAPHAVVTIRDPEFWRALAFGGSVGAGESFARGDWSTDDLVAVVRLFVANRAVLDGVEGGLARLAAPPRALWSALRRNTRSGSRRNIAAHYDLGNDWFGLFLDETWMYSCALFEHGQESLADAQRHKLERICRTLDLRPGMRVLEIGTGWGGFALHAAGRHGCHVTTTTISREQHALATARIAEAGLSQRVDVLLADYRDLTGSYDRLVSIEMVEAVGHEHLDTFFGQCSRLLADDGSMLLQAITIADQLYDRARRETDFIRRHIFPGSFIPCVSELAASARRATDMVLADMTDIGPHYATTLRRWREALLARGAEAEALGYDARFQRLWKFYFAYCEGGFAEGVLGDVHMLFAKPRARRAGHGGRGAAVGRLPRGNGPARANA